MTTLFLSLQITKDSRPPVKWAVNLVIADGHFNFPQELVQLLVHLTSVIIQVHNFYTEAPTFSHLMHEYLT